MNQQMDYDNPVMIRSVALLRSFYDVHKNMMRLVQNTALENGLTVPQYISLITISMQKEMTQKKVGEETFLPKSTLSQAVNDLVQLGLLTRQQVEGNRREMLLMITEKGSRLLNDIHLQAGGVQEAFQHATESLSDQQYTELIQLHQQIAEYLEIKD
ncbi:MarR family winged helix-turn-helix transcriptional regulator [Metabacillus malikii]|uniref:DNA-binding MarR family transcriptional regulator n=1 Tax=Metabacillus malikii TaxID=1504265 RepID=A0ABT9ZHC2_9BACI|nr:MarR family winged helix-turn-helix transcriptional regulator [Metabacillus malikii]MDQ0231684.1 DNA-binding MarR family transcriptional regulator [Metabacillus malikii]